MSKFIRNGRVETDGWKIVRLADGEVADDVKLPVGSLLVPLSVWKLRRRELIHREYEHGWALGVWLAADENPHSIGGDVEDFSVIAIEFDKFSDGNSYLISRVLRERYGYRSELRAIGDVPLDRLSFLHQIGFDSVEYRVGKHVGASFMRLLDFTGIDTRNKLLAA